MALLQVARSKYDIFHFLALHGFRHYMCVLSTPFDDIPVLLPKTLELLFMMTELFLTVPALRVSVRPVRKPLGMHVQGDLPSRQQYQGHDKETPDVNIRYYSILPFRTYR